jgi:hypothetical protein
MMAAMLAALPNAFTYRLAHERGLSDRRLKGCVEDGLLERLGHGAYRRGREGHEAERAQGRESAPRA